GVVTVLDVDRAVALLLDLHRLDLGHPLVFADGVHGRLVAVLVVAAARHAHDDVVPDAEVGRLGRGQQDALDAALADGRRILQVLRAVPLDRAAVALDSVFQPDHGQLPLEQIARRPGILAATLPPEGHSVVEAGVAHRGHAGAAPG